MDGSSLLTNLWRPRQSKWLWPLVGTGSLLVHGLVLVLVRSLTLEVVEQLPPATDPSPIQLITLSPDSDLSVGSDLESAPSAPSEPDARADAASSEPLPRPEVHPPPAEPFSPPIPQPQPPTIRPEPPVVSSPQFPPASDPLPANSPSFPSADPPPPVVAPAPPVSPPVAESPPWVEQPQVEQPRVEQPRVEQPRVEQPPSIPPPNPQPATASEDPVPPAGAETEGISDGEAGATAGMAESLEQAGQLTTRIRPNPMGRDIPDVAPQLQGSNTIAVQPLPLGCAVENLSALMAAVPAATVQLQVLVETDGRISAAYVVPGQGSGNDAVDSLAACLVQDRLSLIPAYAGGAPIRTDAFILETQINF